MENKWKKYFLEILFVSLLSNVYCNNQIEITNNLKTEYKDDKYYFEKPYTYYASFDLSLGKYIYLLVNSQRNEVNCQIYFSYSNINERFSYKNSDFKTTEGGPLIIPTSKIPREITYANIIIECSSFCDYIFNYQIVEEEIVIKKNDKFDIYLDNNDVYKFKYFQNSKNSELITFLSPSLVNFKVETLYQNEKRQLEKAFINGYGLFVNSGTTEENSEDKYYLFILTSLGTEEMIQVNVREYKRNSFSNSIDVEINKNYEILLEVERGNEECFSFQNYNYNSFEQKTYNLSVLTKSDNIILKFGNIFTHAQNFSIENSFEVYQIKGSMNREFCFILEGSKSSGISFKLIEQKESKSESNKFINNLIRGVSYRYNLKKKTLGYFSPIAYRINDNNLEVHYYMTQGNSKIFLTYCKDFSECDFSLDTAIEEYFDVKGHIVMQKQLKEEYNDTYDESKIPMLVVYCPDNQYKEIDCEFDIEIKNHQDFTNLDKNKNVNSFVRENEFELFQISFSEKNKMNQEYLYINIFLFNGDADLTIYKNFMMNEKIEESHYYSNGKNKYYVIINENNNIPETLYIKVSALRDTYYSINYQYNISGPLSKELLETGIVYLKTLPFYISQKSFLWPINDNELQYIITINSINCEMKAKVNDKSYISSKQKVLQIIENTENFKFDNKNNLSLKISVDINNFQENIDSECLFTLEAHSLNSEKKIILPNGLTQINQLNNNNNKNIYIYPFNMQNIKINNNLVVNFKKYTNNIATIKIGTEENNNFEEYKIAKLSKKIIIDSNKISDYCHKEVGICGIIFTISSLTNITEEESSYINFILQVTDKYPTPTYLPKNTFLNFNIQPEQYNYHYFELSKNSESEIVIDFTEGNGNAIAKIIKKGEYERNADYNKKVLLPKKEMEGLINFDYVNKRFVINKKMTNNCDNGCEIYIGIYLLEKSNIMKLNSYSIYSRNLNTNGLVKLIIPESEYIYGTLGKYNFGHLYSTTICSMTNKIIFRINCDDCSVFIKAGNELPSMLNNDFYINSLIQKQIIIKSDYFGINDFYGKTFYLKIESNDQNYFTEKSYSFRILPLGMDLPLIFPITSLQNERCNVTNDFPCYFLVPIEKYNKLDQLRFYVPNEERVTLYANSYDMSIFDFYKDEEIKTLLINNQIYEFSNDKSIFSNYLEVNIDRSSNLEYEKYIIVTVTSSFFNEIIFVSSQFEQQNITYIQPNFYNIYNLFSKTNTKINYQEMLNLIIQSEGTFNFEINILEGKGIVIYENSKNEKIEHLVGFNEKENIKFVLTGGLQAYKMINISPLTDESKSFILLVKYYSVDKNNNLQNLHFHKNNYFYFNSNENEKLWPICFFMKLNITEKDLAEYKNEYAKDLYINYKLNLNNKDSYLEEYSQDLFELNIYLVEKSFIIERKKNPSVTPSEQLKFSSEYKSYIKHGYSFISAQDLYNDKYNYLYFTISPSNFKYIEYKDLDLVITPFDLTEGSFLPKNQYLTFYINNNNQIIKLSQLRNYYKYSSIELVISDKSFYNFTISSERTVQFNLNDSFIFKSEAINYGKSTIKTEFQEPNIFLKFIRDELENKNKNKMRVLLKYTLYENENNKYFYLNKGNTSIEKDENSDNNIAIIHLPSLSNNKNSFPLHEFFVSYNILLYKKYNHEKECLINLLDDKEPDEILNYIYCSNEAEPNSIFYKINGTNVEDYYINILAEANSKEGIYEYFTFEASFLENKKNNESTEFIKEEINIQKNKQYVMRNDSRSYMFIGYFNNTEGQYIKLSLKNKEESNEIINIFVDLKYSEIFPSYSSSSYKTVEKQTSLIIPTLEIPSLNTIYIGIICNKVCNFSLEYQIENIIYLQENENFDIALNNDNNITIEYKPESADDISLITITEYKITNFSIDIKYGNEKIIPENSYFNGYSLLLSPEKYKWEYNKSLIIEINFPRYPNQPNINSEHINIRHRHLNYKDTKISIGDVYYSLVNSYINNDCFTLFKPESNEEYIIYYITKYKNIKIIFYKSMKNKEYIGKEEIIQSETGNLISNSSLYEGFCISYNSDNQNKNEQGILIHLLSFSNINKYQNLNMPLIRGIITNGILKVGQIMYYRINEFSNNMEEKVIIHFSKTFGESRLYYSECNNYPSCNFNIDKLKELNNELSINDNIYLDELVKDREIYHKERFPVVIIYCQNSINSECEYSVGISNTKDIKNLNIAKRIYSTITNFDNDFYQFNILPLKSNKNNSQIKIELYSFTGEADLNFFSDNSYKVPMNNYQFEAYGNKKIFTIENNITQEETFYIQVLGTKNSYYSIFYNITEIDSKNSYVPSGEVNIEGQSIKDGELSYSFNNRMKNYEYSYLIDIYPLNCKLTASFVGQKYYGKNIQIIIDKNSDYYFDSFYEIKIKIDEMEIKNNTIDDDKCMFLISGIEKNESSSTKSLFINDGLKQYFSFNNNFRNLSFTYVLNSIDPTNDIILYFMKYFNNNIELSYEINGINLKKIKIYNKRKIIFISGNEINSQCGKMRGICFVIFNFEEIISENEENDFIKYKDVFSIKIKSSESGPSYLSLGEIETNILNSPKFYYHYFKLNKGCEGEIIIDFLEGDGEAIPKIVPNGVYEENADYNKRINLRFEAFSQQLVVDTFYKKFIITKNMTDKCDNGCELYIAIYNNFPNVINKYNIYHRIFGQIDFIEVNENEYVYGSLSETNITHYYQTKIYKKANKVSFSVKCDNCSIYIIINGNENDFPSEKNSDYKIISSENSNLIINSSFYNKSTFLGDTFKYSIKAINIDGNYPLTYTINIIPIGFDLPLITPMNTLENELCNIDMNTPCYFMLPIYKYNKNNLVNNIALFVPNEELVDIYEKEINMEEFDSSNDTQIKNYLPSNKNNDNNSKNNNNNKNYLKLNIRQEEDIYVLILIESILKRKIIFSASNLDKSSYTSLRRNSFQLYSVNPINNNFFMAPRISVLGKDSYNVEIKLIEGYGSIFISSNPLKNYFLSFDGKESLSFLINTHSSFNQYIVDNNLYKNEDEPKDFVFYIQYKTRSDDNNFDELKFNTNNYFNYISDRLLIRNWPLCFYMKLNLTSDNDNESKLKDLHITFKFSGLIGPSLEIKDYSSEAFELNTYLVNLDFINQRKKSFINPESKTVGYSNYNKETRIGYIYLSSEQIINYNTSDEKYIYITFNSTRENKNNYTEITLDITPFDLSENKFLPRNQYLEISNLEKNDKIILSRINEKYMNLEIEIINFESTNHNNSFQIFNSYTLNNQNNRSLEVIDKRRYNDSKIISITFEEQKKDLLYSLNILNNTSFYNNNRSSDKMLLKYVNYINDSFSYFIKPNLTVNYKIDRLKKTVTLSHQHVLQPIQTSRFIKNYKVSYIIRFYSIEDFDKNDKPNKIINDKKPVKLYKIDAIDYNNSFINYTIKDLPNGAFYLSIIGDAYSQGQYEFFLYDTVLIIQKNKVKLLYGVFIAFVFSLFMILGIYFIWKKLKTAEVSPMNSSLIQKTPLVPEFEE